MDMNFNQSAHNVAPAITPAKNQLVFVSDFQDTLISSGERNYPLLQLLNDAHASGHRVIVASTSAISDVKTILEFMPSFGAGENIDLSHVTSFEVMRKAELKALKGADGKPLHIDFIFDNDPVDYASADTEIRIGRNFKPSPLTLAQVRLSFLTDHLKTIAPDRHP
jgi:hypothetical protein